MFRTGVSSFQIHDTCRACPKLVSVSYKILSLCHMTGTFLLSCPYQIPLAEKGCGGGAADPQNVHDLNLTTVALGTA
jgi:hypothetical protein